MNATHLYFFFWNYEPVPAVENYTGWETQSVGDDGEGVDSLHTQGTITTTDPRSGDAAFKSSGTSSAASSCEQMQPRAATGGHLTNWDEDISYSQTYFRLNTVPTTNAISLLTAASGTNLKADACITPARKIRIYGGGSTQIGSDSTTVVDADKWVGIRFKVGTGATAPYEVQLDTVGDGSWVTELSGTANLGVTQNDFVMVGRYLNYGSDTWDIDFDDFILSRFGWIDDADRVAQLNPDKAGTYLDGTAIPATSYPYERWNETPHDGVSSYIYSQTFGHQHTSLMEALQQRGEPGAGGTGTVIRAVKAHTVSASLGTAPTRVLLRSGTTDSETTDYTQNTTYSTLEKILETDPDTSAAWTVAGLNAIEVGFHHRSASQIRFTKAAAMVLYGVGGPDRRRVAGFESGSQEAEITVGSIEASSSQSHTGSYALRSYATGTATGWARVSEWRGAQNYFNPSIANPNVALWCHLDSSELVLTNVEYWAEFRTTSVRKLTLQLNASRQIILKEAVGTTLGTTTEALTLDTWHCIELYFESSATGRYTLRLDGEVVLTGRGSFGTTGLQEIYLGKTVNTSSKGFVMFYDDLVIDESARVGIYSRVKRMVQDANGAETDFTGQNNKWDDVKEVPHDSDTTYIEAATAGDIYTSTVESASTAGISGTIGCVQVHMVCKAPDVDLPQDRAVIRSGGTTYESDAGSTVGSSYVRHGETWPQDPDTSADWTLSALDTIEPGVKCHFYSRKVRCTQIICEVEFNDPDYVDEAGVSDTFTGAHEVMGYIAGTPTGGHEIMGYLAGTSTGGHEVMQSLLDTFTGGHEALQGVIDTFSGAHEVGEEYMAGTMTGAHEVMGWLAETLAGGHEALQYVADQFTGAHETLGWMAAPFTAFHEAAGYLASPFTGGHEAIGQAAVDNTFDGKHESMLSLLNTFDGGQEALQGVLDQFTGAHEIRGYVAGALDGAHEVMGWITLQASGGHEAMKTLEETYDGGHEAQQNLTDTFDGGHEAAAQITDTFTGAHEAQGYIAGALDGGHEAQQSLLDTFAGAHEAVQGLVGSFAGAHEVMGWLDPTFTGAHEVVSEDEPVSDTFTGGHEVMGWLDPTFSGGHESMQPLEQSFTGEHEALLGVLNQFTGAHEILGWLSKQAAGGHEAMSPIADTFSGGHESMQPVQDTFDGGHEASQFLQDQFTGAHEAEQGAEPVSDTFTGAHEARFTGGVHIAMDAEQIIKWSFDSTNNALRTVTTGAASGDHGTHLDWRQVIKSVYNAATNKLRVTTVT